MLAVLLVLAGVAAPTAAAEPTGSGAWSAPEDFSGRGTFSHSPVLFCDRYQNLHFFWSRGWDTTPTATSATAATAAGSWSGASDIMPAGATLGLGGTISPDDMVHLVWYDGDRRRPDAYAGAALPRR